MRALILVAGACLATAACGSDRAPERNDSNVIQIETVPDDGNWTTVNTDAASKCPKDTKCLPAPEQID